MTADNHAHMPVWLQGSGVREVECLVPDVNGYPRGKVLPLKSFLAGWELRLCRAVAIHTVTGDWADYRFSGEGDPDMRLVPDLSTVKHVPWARSTRALAIHDCIDLDGQATPIASRNVLRSVLEKYADRGWTPIVAPELEFYVLAINSDPDQPMAPYYTGNGRREEGQQGFGFGTLNDLSAFWDEVHAALETLGIRGDTFVHELGPGQFEINLLHGEALDLADQTFLFKYALREIGFKHNLQVVFMAKPLAGKPGSSMHIHQSVIDASGQNIFSREDGEPSSVFYQYIAGLQTCLPDLMPIVCPHVNSYRRFAKHMAAPVNLSWGYDNRTVGIRIPRSGPGARRIENRIPGCDTNPYLVLASSLAAGLYGIEKGLTPSAEISGTVFNIEEETGPALPRSLEGALDRMAASTIARELFDPAFVDAYVAVKETELASFHHEITPWERRYLASIA
ncbi:glutamine synthetase family protein [Burkholderiaceae bacterium DAT-1]|nr:glutamine synthetase family protein [Burkholderiaceae bacterium DAT-1]